MSDKPITFEGIRNFRFRLVLATLAGVPVRITKIRSADLNPGLRDHEVSFLRLLEAVTNGSHIEISYTGATVIYRPGLIIGGLISHNCSGQKPIGYFLEPLLYLAPFSKKKFSVVFTGLTSIENSGCTGIEGIKWGLLPVMEKFGIREAEVHILKRGSAPLGGGELHFMCNSLIAQPLTLHALEVPKFSAIRGVAFCTRVSPSVVNRIIDSARQTLKPTGIEVKITADVWRGEDSGRSPGFGITLVAELKKSWRIFTEDTGLAGSLPEDLGELVAYQLLEELTKSACFGRNQLKLALAYMAIGKEDVGRVVLHRAQVDEELVWYLRDLKALFGTEAFVLEGAEGLESGNENYVTVALKGVGFTSASKKIA